MAVVKKPISLPVPSRGMNAQSLKFRGYDQGRMIANLRLGKYGNIVRRPGYHPYASGYTFDAKTFWGAHEYIDDQNTARPLVVNNESIYEFSDHAKTSRLTGLTAGAYSHFLTALGACFMVNGKENKKGYRGSWAEFGVQGPAAQPILSQSASGGSLQDGTYIVRYSYVVKSNTSRLIVSACDFPETITLNGGGSSQKITAKLYRSTNSRVTHIIVWCTAKDGSEEYFSSEIANPATQTVDVDITAAVDVQGLAYEDYSLNQGPAGPFKWINYNDNRLWAIDSTDPTNLYPSQRGTHYDLEYFPDDFVVAMSKSGKPLNFCFGLNGDQFAMTAREAYKLSNSDINGVPVEVSATIGTEDPFSWAPVANGIIGKSNIGFVFFDGFTFTPIGDDVYNLAKADQNGTFGQGFVFDDPDFGQMYQYCANIPSDVSGGPEEIPGYLPGAGTGGTGLGLPSDDFDDNSKNATRWDSVTGNATITETGGKLAISKTDASAEDVYEQGTFDLTQSINVSCEAAITAHAGASHDLTQYLKLYYDANNYIEIGYRDVNGTLSIRSKIAHGGTVETDDLSTSVPESTTFRIILSHNRAETWYVDSNGAWTTLGVYSYAAWSETAWGLRLGIKATTAASAPTFAGTFDNLRVQCLSGTGFEAITPESTDQSNTNLVLTCLLRGWTPGVYDSDLKQYAQPAWTVESFRAQRLLQLTDGSLLFFDNTTGKVQVFSKYDIFDDMEFIPNVYAGKVIDLDDPSIYKYALWAVVTGNWGMPFTVGVIAYPDLSNSMDTVRGYRSGNAMDVVSMANNALANTDTVFYRAKFKKLFGTAFQFVITKMDADASFAIESIKTEANISGARI